MSEVGILVQAVRKWSASQPETEDLARLQAVMGHNLLNRGLFGAASGMSCCFKTRSLDNEAHHDECSSGGSYVLG